MNDINFLFSHFFLVPQEDETFLRHHKEVKIKIMSFFISVILVCLGRDGLIKVFLLRFSFRIAFTNVPFRHFFLSL